MRNNRGRLVHVERDEQGLLEVYEDACNRSLYFGNAHRQSSRSLHQPDTLVLDYTRCMLSALLFNPQPQRVLLIGLGGGSLALFLLQHFPRVHITAVESRPSVVTIARRFFSLPDRSETRLRVVIDDGVAFIRHNEQRYDLILVDAFDPEGIHPGVCQADFFTALEHSLDQAGVMSMNLWTQRSLPYQEVLRAIRQAFSAPPLKLPLGRHSNLIALGLKDNGQPVSFPALREPARQLKKQLRIDFSSYLRLLQRHNGNLFSRLFGRG